MSIEPCLHSWHVSVAVKSLLTKVRRAGGLAHTQDHEKIKEEWNAFCEMRHPVFSKLLNGIGPLDGSVPGVPDRRLSGAEHRAETQRRMRSI